MLWTQERWQADSRAKLDPQASSDPRNALLFVGIGAGGESHKLCRGSLRGSRLAELTARLICYSAIASQIKIWAPRSGIEASAGVMVNESNRLKPQVQKII
jgi:hypothetical protein